MCVGCVVLVCSSGSDNSNNSSNGISGGGKGFLTSFGGLADGVFSLVHLSGVCSYMLPAVVVNNRYVC